MSLSKGEKMCPSSCEIKTQTKNKIFWLRSIWVRTRYFFLKIMNIKSLYFFRDISKLQFLLPGLKQRARDSLGCRNRRETLDQRHILFFFSEMFWFVWSWIVPIDRSHRSQSYRPVSTHHVTLWQWGNWLHHKKKSFSHSRGWMLNISVCIWIIVIVRSSFCRFHIQLQNVTVFFLHRRSAAHGWKVCETHNVAHRSSHTYKAQNSRYFRITFKSFISDAFRVWHFRLHCRAAFESFTVFREKSLLIFINLSYALQLISDDIASRSSFEITVTRVRRTIAKTAKKYKQ